MTSPKRAPRKKPAPVAAPEAAEEAAAENEYISGEETGEVDEAGLFDMETEEAQSLADLAGTGGGIFEGPLVKMEAIKNMRHTVLDFKMIPSTYREGDYVCIQIKMGGELMVVNSTAQVIMKGLAVTDKSKLPVPNAFVMRTGKKEGSKSYWDFASSDEMKKLK